MTSQDYQDENDPRPKEQRFSVNTHPLREGVDSVTPIWRYMDLHAALSTILMKRLRFTRVSRFRDEWESRRGAASRGIIDEQDRGMAAHSNTAHLPWPNKQIDNLYRDRNFVSSWTLENPNQMSMWLAYTNSEASVAIQSTISELGKLSTVGLDFADLGLIKYVDPDTWVHHSRDNRELLFVKRPAFEFEKEVRFAVQPFDAFSQAGHPKDYFGLPIKFTTISKIVVNPYMNGLTTDLLKEIVSKYGLPIKVEKSLVASRHTYD